MGYLYLYCCLWCRTFARLAAAAAAFRSWCGFIASSSSTTYTSRRQPGKSALSVKWFISVEIHRWARYTVQSEAEMKRQQSAVRYQGNALTGTFNANRSTVLSITVSYKYKQLIQQLVRSSEIRVKNTNYKNRKKIMNTKQNKKKFFTATSRPFISLVQDWLAVPDISNVQEFSVSRMFSCLFSKFALY